MALWAAHFGGADEAFRNPSSDECLQRVREITAANWELYTADEPQHSDVHMLPYPIQVPLSLKYHPRILLCLISSYCKVQLT